MRAPEAERLSSGVSDWQGAGEGLQRQGTMATLERQATMGAGRHNIRSSIASLAELQEQAGVKHAAFASKANEKIRSRMRRGSALTVEEGSQEQLPHDPEPPVPDQSLMLLEETTQMVHALMQKVRRLDPWPSLLWTRLAVWVAA